MGTVDVSTICGVSDLIYNIVFIAMSAPVCTYKDINVIKILHLDVVNL